MPYKLIKNKVYGKVKGKWRIKQTCKSVASAKRALKLLRGLEAGSIKPSEVGRGKFAKKPSLKKVGRGKGLKEWKS